MVGERTAEFGRDDDGAVPAAEDHRPDMTRWAAAVRDGVVHAELRESHKRPLVRGLLVGQTLATVPQAEREIDRLQGLARDNLVSALERLRDATVLREDLETDVGARLLQDLEIAALLKSERRKDPEELLARLDWRRSIGLLVRGMRRPLSLAPAHARH